MIYKVSVYAISSCSVTITVCICMPMYVCMYICMCVYISVCMCVCAHIYACVCMYLCMCICVYACVYMCVCVHECACMCMYSYVCVCIYVFTNSPYEQDVIQCQFLRGVWIQFSFSLTGCCTKVKEPSLPYYLPIARGRIVGFIFFIRLLLLYKVQSALSRIWTQFTMSISTDDNHYTTSIFIIISK